MNRGRRFRRSRSAYKTRSRAPNWKRYRTTSHFRITSLLPGTYRVQAIKPGFEKVLQQGLVITTGQTIAVDFTLKVGATSDVVTIHESAPLAETQSQSVGQLINRRMVATLPMPNRAASSLVALAPGVVMIDPGSGAENYPVFSVEADGAETSISL